MRPLFRVCTSVVVFVGLATCGERMGFAFQFAEEKCDSLPALTKVNRCGEIVYRNNEYGFAFTVPKSWKGLSVLECRWGGGNGERETDQGPLILIRHPLSTAENPRMDIDIMVFTQQQWSQVDDGSLIVSAAPVEPGEIGRNRKYVFALPPRFAAYDLPGAEEVLDILRDNPLRPARIKQTAHTNAAHDYGWGASKRPTEN